MISIRYQIETGEKMNNKKIAEIVTNQIIDLLEKDIPPWKVCWSNYPTNIKTKKRYHGFNVLALNVASYKMEFEHNLWLTFKQAKELGGKVIKGSHGSQIIHWHFSVYEIAAKKYLSKKEVIDRKLDTRNLPDDYKLIAGLRYFTVFNIAQIEGVEIPEDLLPTKKDRIACAESVINGYKNPPKINFSGNQPSYCVDYDVIEIPAIDHFKTADNYYSTMFHEMTHSTGHKKRLNRDMRTSILNNTKRSKEELIAELGAAFLNAHCGIESTLNSNAAYCKSWLKVLNDDRMMLISAAGKAEKAADYILGNK